METEVQGEHMEGERKSDLHVYLDEGSQEETALKEKTVLKESRPWLRDAKSRVRVGLRVSVRYGLHWGRRWGWPALKWSAALSLPFFVLVRGSMYAYQGLGWSTWPSIGLGVFGTIVVFSVYASWLWKRLTGEGRLPQIAQRILIAVVAGYSVYGLLYLSAGNAKSPELTEYYTSLHPLMRLGASTYFIFDRDAVVTDLERTAEDYLAMGLPINETSLHFKLEDRYVHAMDLRTIGRSPRRNALTVAYFRIMGFRSLHHVGTADHLHVSLPVRGS
jgi:hypothetical protein